MATDAEMLAELEAARDRILRGDQATSVMVTPNAHRVDSLRRTFNGWMRGSTT